MDGVRRGGVAGRLEKAPDPFSPSEGEHYVDRNSHLHASQREYRGYEVSSWVAQGLGFRGWEESEHPGRGTIWDELWSPGLRQMFFNLGFFETWKDYYRGYYRRDNAIYFPLDPRPDN